MENRQSCSQSFPESGNRSETLRELPVILSQKSKSRLRHGLMPRFSQCRHYRGEDTNTKTRSDLDMTEPPRQGCGAGELECRWLASHRVLMSWSLEPKLQIIIIPQPATGLQHSVLDSLATFIHWQTDSNYEHNFYQTEPNFQVFRMS